MRSLGGCIGPSLLLSARHAICAYKWALQVHFPKTFGALGLQFLLNGKRKSPAKALLFRLSSGLRRSSKPSVLRQQATKTKIVHHVLHLLHAVLNTIAPLPQGVVLQVEDLEPSMDVLDELCDLQWAAVVTQSDRVARKACLGMISRMSN